MTIERHDLMSPLRFWIGVVLHLVVLGVSYGLRMTGEVPAGIGLSSFFCLASARDLMGHRAPRQHELVEHFGRDVVWPVFLVAGLAINLMPPEIFIGYCVLLLVGGFFMKPGENREQAA